MKNNIIYSGKVRIKTNNNSVVKKPNSGTFMLFRTLCELLTNVTANDTRSIPSHIAIIYDDTAVFSKESFNEKPNYSDYSDYYILSTPAPIALREVVTQENKYTTRFTCFLPNSLLLSFVESLSSHTKIHILMLNSYKQILAAVSDYQLQDLSGVIDDANGQVAIEWEMSFANKEEN